MALNRAVRFLLKVISLKDMNMKKNYKMVRRIIQCSHFSYNKSSNFVSDRKIRHGDTEVPIRIYSARPAGKPIVIFFHGGGFVTGSVKSYDRVCRNLANITEHTVVSVDYRLAPEFPFPAALNDCYHVVKNVVLHAGKQFQISPKQVTIMGDSAGGNLAAALSLLARDRGEFHVSRQILIYPSVNNDFSENSPFPSVHENGKDYFMTSKRLCDYMDLYQSSYADRKSPYFAPLLAEDLSCQPKTLIITAQYDPLRDEGEAYGKKLKQFHNQVKLFEIKDIWHGFFTLPIRYAPVMTCFQIIKKFLQEEP